ncbi:MAG: hypothetical protein WDZ80_06000 [Candidatus Paceibacterota bacterium]
MKIIYGFLTTLLIIFGIEGTVLGQDVSGNLSFMTSGASPIPSFGIEEPAFYGDISVDYGKVIVVTDMAFTYEGHIWFSDIWLKYKPIQNLSLGVDYSTFGQNYSDKLNGDLVRESTRYLAFEVYGETSTEIEKMEIDQSFKYWYSHGMGDRTLNGHFLMTTTSLQNLFKINSVGISISNSIFYIDFTGDNDGLFISPSISASHNSLPFSLTFQAVPPIISNIPSVETQFSLITTYSF